MKKRIWVLIGVITLVTIVVIILAVTPQVPPMPVEMPAPAEEEKAATARVSEPAIPAHFTTYTDEVGLFSISYPPDWELALWAIEDLEQSAKEIIEGIESDLPLERASIIFFAGLPTETGYMPSVNIVVESFPGVVLTHDEVVEAQIRGVKDIVQDYHEFSRIKTTIGGKEATILDWERTFPGFPEQRSLQLFMFVDKIAWVITSVSPAGEFSKWEEDLHAMLRSFRILK